MPAFLPAALRLEVLLEKYSEEMPAGWKRLDMGGQTLFPRHGSPYLTTFVGLEGCFWLRGLEIIVDPESGPFEVYAQIRDAIAFTTKGDVPRGTYRQETV